MTFCFFERGIFSLVGDPLDSLRARLRLQDLFDRLDLRHQYIEHEVVDGKNSNWRIVLVLVLVVLVDSSHLLSGLSAKYIK